MVVGRAPSGVLEASLMPHGASFGAQEAPRRAIRGLRRPILMFHGAAFGARFRLQLGSSAPESVSGASWPQDGPKTVPIGSKLASG